MDMHDLERLVMTGVLPLDGSRTGSKRPAQDVRPPSAQRRVLEAPRRKDTLLRRFLGLIFGR